MQYFMPQMDKILKYTLMEPVQEFLHSLAQENLPNETEWQRKLKWVKEIANEIK